MARTHSSYLIRPAEPLQISGKKGGASISLSPHRAALLSLQCRAGSTPTTLPARAAAGSHTPLPLLPNTFSSPIPAPAAGGLSLGTHPAWSRSQGCTIQQSEGKHSFVVIEDAALQLLVCIHSSKEQARFVAGGHGWQEEMQAQHYRP